MNNLTEADKLVYEFKNLFEEEEINNELKILLSKLDINAFIKKLNESINIIEKTIKSFKNEEICVSFNGGKDCCVCLYLYYAVAKHLKADFPLNILSFEIDHEFEEMIKFQEYLIKTFYKDKVVNTVLNHDLTSIKVNLIRLKEDNSPIKCILMGNRRTDGFYFEKMKHFSQTDIDWPHFLRVNPILGIIINKYIFYIVYLSSSTFILRLEFS
jgi:hypothetical protein